VEFDPEFGEQAVSAVTAQKDPTLTASNENKNVK
jgi:hypothetical protein